MAGLALVLQDAATKKRGMSPGIFIIIIISGKPVREKIRREHERLRAGQMEIKSDPELEGRREGWVSR